MPTFKVNFEYADGRGFSTNLCDAPDERSAIERYAAKGRNVYEIHVAQDYEIREAEAKGMPRTVAGGKD